MRRFMPAFDRLRRRPLTPEERETLGEFIGGAFELLTFPFARGRADENSLQRAPEPGEPYFCLHAKSLVIDGETVFIGSYNLDPRSENLNTEAGLVIRDPAVAGLVKENIRRDSDTDSHGFSLFFGFVL